MQRDMVMSLLRAEQERLQREFNVKSLAIFGSVARNEALDASDVDLLVEFDRPVGLLHLIGTEQFLEHLLDSDTDLVLKRSLLPELKDGILAESIDVF